MIAEMFLTCALSAAPMAMSHSPFTNGPAKAVHAVTTEIDIEVIRHYLKDYPRYHDRLGIEAGVIGHDLGIFNRVLLVGGDPIHLKTMREYGLKTFGAYTEDWPEISRFHAVADAGRLSFKDLTFEAVFWHHHHRDPGNLMEWLVDATMLVVEGGYFVYEEERYPHWEDYLMAQGWTRFRFPKYMLTAWQRPFRAIATPAYGHMKKVIIFPKTKWRMRWGVSERMIESAA